VSTLSNQYTNNHITNHPYNYSDRQDCRVIIEVMDKGHSRRRLAGIYAIAVPYNRFSQTLHSIHCAGGKVCNVSISQLQLDAEQTVVPVETVLETVNEPVNFSASENVLETKSIAGEAIDTEVFEDHVVGSHINAPTIVESIVVGAVEAIESVVADINIPEEPPIVSIPNPAPIIEVFGEKTIDVAVNVEISPSPSKATKTKASAKTTAGGFNKPKNDKNPTKSPRKPKN
jgi:hypothetical protein